MEWSDNSLLFVFQNGIILCKLTRKVQQIGFPTLLKRVMIIKRHKPLIHRIKVNFIKTGMTKILRPEVQSGKLICKLTTLDSPPSYLPIFYAPRIPPTKN